MWEFGKFIIALGIGTVSIILLFVSFKLLFPPRGAYKEYKDELFVNNDGEWDSRKVLTDDSIRSMLDG